MIDKEKAEAISADLMAGVASDIWYDADDHGDESASETIEATQAAMTEAAALLRKLPAILAFVEQMACMTTLDDEYDADDEEGAELRARYDDVDEYQSDLDDDRLCGEFEAFQAMIREARKLLA